MKNLNIVTNCGRLGAGDQREEWIESIMNNSHFDQEELEEMSDERLKFLASKLQPWDDDEQEEVEALTQHLEPYKPGNKAKTTQEENDDEAEEMQAMTSFLDEPKSKKNQNEEELW